VGVGVGGCIGGPPFGQSGAVAPPKKYEMLEIWTKFVQKDDFFTVIATPKIFLPHQKFWFWPATDES
jgi:hypothetical protein